MAMTALISETIKAIVSSCLLFVLSLSKTSSFCRYACKKLVRVEVILSVMVICFIFVVVQ